MEQWALLKKWLVSGRGHFSISSFITRDELMLTSQSLMTQGHPAATAETRGLKTRGIGKFHVPMMRAVPLGSRMTLAEAEPGGASTSCGRLHSSSLSIARTCVGRDVVRTWNSLEKGYITVEAMVPPMILWVKPCGRLPMRRGGQRAQASI